MSDTIGSSPSESARPNGRAATILFAAATVGVLGLALFGLIRPWLGANEPPAPSAHFAPLGEGDAALYTLYDGAGAQIGWRSVNVDLLSKLELFTELPDDIYTVVHSHFFPVDATDSTTDDAGLEDSRAIFARMGNARGARVAMATRLNDGSLTRQEAVVLEDETGRYLVSIEYLDEGATAIYDPPMRLLPQDLETTTAWMSTGLLSSVLPYTVTARVVGTTPMADDPARACVDVEAVQEVSDGQGGRFSSTALDSYCPGIGTVSSTIRDADGAVLESAKLRQSTRQQPPQDAVALPPMPPASGQGAATDMTSIVPPASPASPATGLRRFGQVSNYYTTGGGTFQPVILPGEPPRLLVSAYESYLAAYGLDGTELWRFVAGGSIFAPPAADPLTGMIYFGTSDKRFIALDRDGLFQWAFSTGDNNATTPLLVENRIIFASEDRHIYALDARSGRLLWQVKTESPMVSSPALAGDTIVIGADSGLVRGLAPETGAVRWEFAADGPVEADIRTSPDGRVAYVAGRDGQVIALDGESGAVLWQVTPGFGPGSPIGYAPVLHGERMAVIGAGGALSILDSTSGDTLWSTHLTETFVPPAAFDGDTVLATTAFGRVLRYDADGALMEELDLSAASSPGDPTILLHVGPVAAGNAIWLIDSASIIYRFPARGAERKRE